MTPEEKQLAADMPSVINPHLTLDDAADFTWDFGCRFLLETKFGNYVWYDPDYEGGDNTIHPWYGNPLDFTERGFSGRWKGNHIIREFCGPNALIVTD